MLVICPSIGNDEMELLDSVVVLPSITGYVGEPDQRGCVLRTFLESGVESCFCLVELVLHGVHVPKRD